MGRAFEYRKAAKLKRWGHMAKTFTRLGKQIAIAVKAGGPEPENNPTLRSVIATCKRENMPKDNIERAIKNAMGKDQSDYKGMTYEGYGPHGVAAVSYTHLISENSFSEAVFFVYRQIYPHLCIVDQQNEIKNHVELKM